MRTGESWGEPSAVTAAARARLQSLRMGASEHLRVGDMNATHLVVPTRPLSYEAERVIHRIFTESVAIAGPFPIEVKQATLSMILLRVMYSAYLIDNFKSGERKVPLVGFGTLSFPRA
jgi:hypothetical protein